MIKFLFYSDVANWLVQSESFEQSRRNGSCGEPTERLNDGERDYV